MKIHVPKESLPGENRVAVVPDTIDKLKKLGHTVTVEKGAGLQAFFTDEQYQKAGAQIVSDSSAWKNADLVVKVGVPTEAETQQLSANASYIGFLNPLADASAAKRLAAHNVTAFSVELIPRISRAQSMDVLSSQANIAGYKSVLIAAEKLPKYFPMLTTAAGTIIPAKVLIIGVGVAGLQAIATARRLGAVVEAFDIRPEVKEQVQSLGAKFVEVELSESGSGQGGYAKEVSEDTKRKLQEALADRVAASDVVITTAQVPGKKAPRLVTEPMIERMKPGSILIDLASEQGGNAAYSKPGEWVNQNGVLIGGPVNVPSSVAMNASQMYSRNIFEIIKHITKDGNLQLNFEDEIVRGACVCHQGKILNERIQ